MDLKVQVERVKGLSEKCIEAHRGDGLAEPTLALCNVLLHAMRDEEPEPAPAPKPAPKTSAAAKK